MADPYATLGVARGASEQDIKSAYRKLAKELHPDRNKDNPKASERFSDVTRAYDLLSDKDKRAQFDRGEIDADGNPAMPFGGGRGFGGGFGGGPQGHSARDFGGSEDVDLGDIFEGLFGGRAGGGFGGRGGGGFGRNAPPPRGGNTAYRLQVSFIDAATQAPQRITLNDGKTIDLKLPAGLEDGTQMRLKGKGEAGPGGAGDALVTLHVGSHPFFTRDGDDIRLELPITLDEAVNGARVKAPTVDGAVMLTVAAGSGSGKVLRLKGKGFSRKDGGRGDLLVVLTIDLPEGEEREELARRLDGWQDSRQVRAQLGV
ncbi:DnaJ domain-containing protein [Altererythrobacter xixiisoli]|uniref:DnaJ domain-containing protein n=1 Tax=Croceibacterium xixiisoli TaxID=1476466 RepID=A0A6I4TN46_9SPHN|nr:J domain-containing protein [Croceibacterium xixiisoli]MXO97384.1 DnaJ domain-containing protein [Croceibacterium xixiisoli]